MERSALKIPKNKQIFLYPSLNKFNFYLEKNKTLFKQYSFKISNQPFQMIRESNRKKIVQKANQFNQQYNIFYEKKINSYHQNIKIIQTGHQPTFFHPGVWIKNIFLDKIIKSSPNYNQLGLNIILDNDIYREPSFYLPVKFDSGDIKLEKINFLYVPLKIPFEETSLPTLAQVKQFSREVINKIIPLKNKNMLANFIDFSKCLEKSLSLCCQKANETNFGEFLGIARRYSEYNINPAYHELSFSKICDSNEFLSFFLEIAKNIDFFCSIYNGNLDIYRKHHKIRNRVNPSPNLLIEENLIELPFWIWKKGDIRRKFYTLKENNKLFFYNEVYGKFFFFENNNLKTCLKLKRLLKDNQIKIRPRALLLTLYNRLFISDLFIHGIGGAKYDEITNNIIKDFFHVEPPLFYTISATLLLDLKSFYTSTDSSIPILRKKLRDLSFNPENNIADFALLQHDKTFVQQLIKTKKELINEIKKGLTLDEKKSVSNKILKINLQIKEKLRPLEIELKEKLDSIEKYEKQSEVYTFREFPFCFFSAKEVTKLFSLYPS